MSETVTAVASPWEDAALAAALFAVDPVGLGGVIVRALPGPVRDEWLALLAELLPAGTPFRRLPLHVGDGRLLGGLDLAATLKAGRPVAERGILSEVDGGVLVLAMAERVESTTAARLAVAIDTGEAVAERDGLSLRMPARIGLVALDEGLEPDERPPTALIERMAIPLDFTPISVRELSPGEWSAEDIAAARGRLGAVRVEERALEALCAAGIALGIPSLRAPLQALAVARASAALDGRDTLADEDLQVATKLVMFPRATQLPAPQQPPEEAPEPPPQSEGDSGTEEEEQEMRDDPLEDTVQAAAEAALPAHLLAGLRLAGARVRGASAGRAGAMQNTTRRGRPAGVRQGEPRSGARMNVVETLRSAAPWQALRRRESGRAEGDTRIEVRREDFRITRLKHRAETTTIFAVDASGSSALHRLAEAKGAVELLLADCYVRRDRVALVAFRGKGAELLLPPTRSLVRAKRSLARLPGGGGTPLAAGVDAAVVLAEAARRRGDTPVLIVLTDGRANVARDGSGGRERAGTEAMSAARSAREMGLSALLVDTSPRPQETARLLAAEMGAQYLALPRADAGALSVAVRAATAAST